MDRDELLEREHASWSAFEAAVGRVPADRRADDGVEPGWSVKDLVWHCAYWAGFCADTIEARRRATSPIRGTTTTCIGTPRTTEWRGSPRR
jgi:hypothetical protein